MYGRIVCEKELNIIINLALFRQETQIFLSCSSLQECEVGISVSLVYETVHQITSSLQLITCGKAMLPKEEKMPHQPGRNPKDLVTSGESGVALCGGQCDTLSDTRSLCGISAKFKRNL